MERHTNYGLWLALLATLLIASCGIKPTHLEPPAGTDKNDFPRTYPTSAE